MTVSQTIRPFLMFQDGQAEAAMTFYVSLFPDSEILDIERYGASGLNPEGSVIRARFRVGGQEIFCSDSFVKHAFDFTPCPSLFVGRRGRAPSRRRRGRGRGTDAAVRLRLQPPLRVDQRQVRGLLAAQLGLTARPSYIFIT
jgi:hypothetical protein